MKETSVFGDMFHGQIRVIDTQSGTKWKSGCIAVEKADQSYLLRVTFDVGSSRAFQVTHFVIKYRVQEI